MFRRQARGNLGDNDEGTPEFEVHVHVPGNLCTASEHREVHETTFCSTCAMDSRGDEATNSAAVADFLTILEEHMKNCERSGKYVEAEIARKRLEELRQHEDSRREESLRSRQVAQRLGVEEAHMLEFQQFNAMWDHTMKEYEERAGELLEAMRQRHELDAREFRATHESAVTVPKWSPKVLDLRQVERTLAKQGQYMEAQKVKDRAEKLEAEETQRAAAEREEHLHKLESGLAERQDQEVSALRQRIQTGAEEQRVARQQDLERLLRRYHNIKAELDSQQHAERLRQRKGGVTALALAHDSSRASLRSSAGGRANAPPAASPRYSSSSVSGRSPRGSTASSGSLLLHTRSGATGVAAVRPGRLGTSSGVGMPTPRSDDPPVPPPAVPVPYRPQPGDSMPPFRE